MMKMTHSAGKQISTVHLLVGHQIVRQRTTHQSRRQVIASRGFSQRLVAPAPHCSRWANEI